MAQDHAVLFMWWKISLYFIKGLVSASLCLIRFSAEDMRLFSLMDKKSDSLKAGILLWSPMKFSEIMKRKKNPKNLFFCFGVFQENELNGLIQSTKKIILLTILEWKRIPRDVQVSQTGDSVILLSDAVAK